MAREVIALAGVGNLGKYLCEELLSSSIYSVIVISRNGSEWLEAREVKVYISDYSKESVLGILTSTRARVLISFINCSGPLYFVIHKALFEACKDSQTCKRMIPSEWIGNVEEFPHLPRFYADSRGPFRKFLRGSSGIEWTLFNGGWLMDYFLTKDRTYMPAIPDEFPIDPSNWRACIRGTGDELQAFTSSRDISKALVELLGATQWEQVIYVVGEWTTFNNTIKIMEEYQNRPMEITYKTEAEIARGATKDHDGELTREGEIAQVEEWMLAGASACPREKTLKHREKYFSRVKFHTISELLQEAGNQDFLV